MEIELYAPELIKIIKEYYKECYDFDVNEVYMLEDNEQESNMYNRVAIEGNIKTIKERNKVATIKISMEELKEIISNVLYTEGIDSYYIDIHMYKDRGKYNLGYAKIKFDMIEYKLSKSNL